ncbi:hypothetical protein ZIOFF_046073 [Zingiber officinale]|uniref:Methyl-CpG-binding domain-containing protein 2 n=2 Tax=Zingiber officinale TaxID=94328 RepID=A0A8J5G7Y1_ZINOF|nr:hypothetical protein ZIOFF_046073 [Zingiber officinale]
MLRRNMVPFMMTHDNQSRASVLVKQVLKVSTNMQSHLEDTSLRHRSPEFSDRGKKRSLHMIDGDPMYSGNPSIEGHSKELVLYDPGTSGMSNDTPAVTNHIENYTPTFRNFLAPNPSNRTYSAIGTFTVQCASCFKWRIIPTKEKYEQIREKILEEYFVCEHAREWRPTIRCEDPEDISQDGSRVWAIDKPNIAQPPSGWERLLRIRGEGGTKFADVYYTAPSGKKLRSMVEVQRYLLEHPEYARQGVTLSQFSFQAPRPLQENYVRKRPIRFMNPSDGSDLLLQRPLEVEEVIPLSCAAPSHKEQLVGAQASPNTFPEKTIPSPPNESTPTAMPPSEQMKLNNELTSNAPFNPLFWPAAHTHKESLVGAPALPNAASEKSVSYPNDMRPLTDLPPSEKVKLTNEHPARASSFNPFSWATLPANKELNLGGAAVSSLNESILPTSMSPEEMKLKDGHPTNPTFNPFSWVDLPTYKEQAIGGPASRSTTPEELVCSPPNESTLPASMPPPEQMKLKDKRPADASPCEL